MPRRSGGGRTRLSYAKSGPTWRSEAFEENFRAVDPASFERITASFAHWDDIDVRVHGHVISWPLPGDRVTSGETR